MQLHSRRNCYVFHVFHFLIPLRNVEIPFYLHLISRHVMSKYEGLEVYLHALIKLELDTDE